MVERDFWGKSIYHIAMFLSKVLTKLRYVGQDNLPDEGPYIIVANHLSLFDGLWIMGGIPKEHLPITSCMAGADLAYDYGLIGKIMLRVGRSILVDRHGNPIRGLIMAKKKLDEGNIIMIHPEGTRSHDGKIAEMKNGAAYLAEKTGAVIIPTYIDGAYEIFSRHMSVPHPMKCCPPRRKTLKIEYGEAIDANAKNYSSVDETMEAVSKWLLTKEKEAFAKKGK